MTAATAGVYEGAELRRVTADAIRPGGLALTDRAVELAGLPRGAVVLDVGCGAGTAVERLVDRHALAAVGIDPSATLVAAGRARRPGLPLLRGCAQNLPLAESTADAVLVECVLSLAPEPRHALAEIARVLRPDGLLIVSDLYARNAGAAGQLRRLPPRSCLHGAFTQQGILDLIGSAGFRLRCWEDRSDALTQLAVQLLWENGSAAQLWCPGRAATDPPEFRAAVRAARPGYFLLLAENTGR